MWKTGKANLAAQLSWQGPLGQVNGALAGLSQNSLELCRPAWRFLGLPGALARLGLSRSSLGLSKGSL